MSFIVLGVLKLRSRVGGVLSLLLQCFWRLFDIFCLKTAKKLIRTYNIVLSILTWDVLSVDSRTVTFP